jgi:hypothetical protein
MVSVLRANPLAPTVPPPAPASAVWRIGIRVGFVLAFIAAYAMIFFFATAPATLHDRANSQIPGAPHSLLVLEASFLLLPFLTAFVLLFQTRHQALMATGSGIAVGLFGLFLLVSPFAFLTMFMLLGLSGSHGADPGLSRAVLALLFLIPISIWIVVCGVFNGKRQWVAFVVGAFITMVYLSAGWGRMRTSEYRVEQKQRRAAEVTTFAASKTNYDAHRAAALLAGCLIEYHAAHPNRGFPASLSALPPGLHLPSGTACDTTLVNPGAVSGYTLTYSPQQDPATGRFTDFLLVAMPLHKGRMRVDPIAVDSRGRIFVYVGWCVTNPEPLFAPSLTATPDDLWASGVRTLRSEVDYFTKNNGGTPPALLSNLSWHPQGAPSSDPHVMNAGPYELKYLPTASDPTRFSVSADCQSYGDACIRSFFIGPDGEIHQTIDPRPATPTDPLIPDCEKYAQTCRDIDWPLPPG